jgi:hypothetical protein
MYIGNDHKSCQQFHLILCLVTAYSAQGNNFFVDFYPRSQIFRRTVKKFPRTSDFPQNCKFLYRNFRRIWKFYPRTSDFRRIFKANFLSQRFPKSGMFHREKVRLNSVGTVVAKFVLVQHNKTGRTLYPNYPLTYIYLYINWCKTFQMAINFANVFHSKALLNVKCKYTHLATLVVTVDLKTCYAVCCSTSPVRTRRLPRSPPRRRRRSSGKTSLPRLHR